MNKTLIMATSLIVAGLTVSVVGLLVVANAVHHLKYFSLGEDLGQWREAKDWGQNLEIVGTAIMIGGVFVILFLRKRKGSPAVTSIPKEGPVPGTL